MADDISLALSQILGKEVPVIKLAPVTGGSINRAYKAETRDGWFFIKENDASAFPGMFEAEAKGLQLLKKHSSLKVPEVVGATGVGQQSYIVTEFLQTGSMQAGFWKEFGYGLAKLHLATHSNFGLDHDNYIGSLPQLNGSTDAWPVFFIEKRIGPQLKQARDSRKVDRETVVRFDRLLIKVPEYFQPEQPSLLHGDLWSGNFLCCENGNPAIFDPATYYGHRLMDIGMTKLFGGFDSRFYEAYKEAWPLQDNWREGAEVANLYPLLVHVNLFGSGYLSQVNTILKRYG